MKTDGGFIVKIPPVYDGQTNITVISRTQQSKTQQIYFTIKQIIK